jgi:hypothetical protein
MRRTGNFGVSDGLRITSDPLPHQQDQLLSSADRGKKRQIERKSATSRNQESGSQERMMHDETPDKEDAS